LGVFWDLDFLGLFWVEDVFLEEPFESVEEVLLFLLEEVFQAP